MPDSIPAEAAQAAAKALDHHYDTVRVHEPDWLCCARAVLEVAASVLAAQARREAVNQVRPALEEIALRTVQRDLNRLAREALTQIGEDQ